jgi:hypothetical protein
MCIESRDVITWLMYIEANKKSDKEEETHQDKQGGAHLPSGGVVEAEER